MSVYTLEQTIKELHYVARLTGKARLSRIGRLSENTRLPWLTGNTGLSENTRLSWLTGNTGLSGNTRLSGNKVL